MKKALTLIALIALATALHAQEIPNTAPPPPPADISKLPHVVILNTGGGIADREPGRMTLTGFSDKDLPRATAADWYKALPELGNFAQIKTEDLLPPVGAPDTFAQLSAIAHRVNELAKDPAVDGIVVAHSTDTLAEVGFYLNLVVATDKPVVVTGALRPWSSLSGDGPINLYDAVRVAAYPAAKGKGVLNVMNQNINPARDVNETIAYRVQTFKGIDTGTIGFADPDRVIFYREPFRKHTSGSEFAGLDLKTLPPVEIFYAYTDAPGYAIDAAVAHGAKGLVFDGIPSGTFTPAESEAIKRAQAKGVVVVLTSRTGGGRVQNTPLLEAAKLVPGDNLPPEKARLLLQLALTKTHDPKEIKRYFDQY